MNFELALNQIQSFQYSLTHSHSLIIISSWDMVQPTIPPFSVAYYMRMEVMPAAPLNLYSKITSGGCHSFDCGKVLVEQKHMEQFVEVVEPFLV